MEVIAFAALAAETQPVIVSPMTQYTNVLAATIVSATRIHDCRSRQGWFLRHIAVIIINS